jgi:hypothetical protein
MYENSDSYLVFLFTWWRFASSSEFLLKAISIHTSAFLPRGGEFIIIRLCLIGLFAFDETCTQFMNSFSSSSRTNALSSLLSDRDESLPFILRESSSECSHALNYVSLALSASWSF